MTTSSKSGFALLEVLAALVMTLLLVVTLTPFVRQILLTWARGSETAHIIEFETRGLGLLRRDLQNAVVWTGHGGSDALAVFRGNETSMAFPVAVTPSRYRGGVEYLSFTIEASADGQALVRRHGLVTGSTYETPTSPSVMISGPYKYIFKYYTRDGENVPVWTEDKFDLPGVIELDVVDRNGLLFGAPITMPAFASFSAACFVSPSLRGCDQLTPPPETQDLMKSWGITPAGGN
jgi:hypothetical protein